MPSIEERFNQKMSRILVDHPGVPGMPVLSEAEVEEIAQALVDVYVLGAGFLRRVDDKAKRLDPEGITVHWSEPHASILPKGFRRA